MATLADLIHLHGIGVQSECGKLDIVLMHRPGNELRRLTPDNLNELLYDGIPNLDETHASHDKFTEYLSKKGTHVLYVVDLLKETLNHSNEARETLINGILSNSQLKEEKIALKAWLNECTSEQLAQDVIHGVAWSSDELGTSDAAKKLLDKYGSGTKFVIPPLPNLLFTRDAFSIIEKNVFILKMARAARQNEPLIFRVIFQYHPDLSTSGLQLFDWQRDNMNDQEATVEGGDIAYIGDGTLLIGQGERTNRAGVEAIALTGLFRQVIAIQLPRQWQYMHLDTVLSSVGIHAFTLHSLLNNVMEVFTVKALDENSNPLKQPIWTSYGKDTREALRHLLNDPDLIFYDAIDEETSVIEQRDCRHNVLAIGNCHVMTYEGGDEHLGIVAQMIMNNACQVGLIPTQGLLEGVGGAHCMTNAVCRHRY